MFCRFTNQPAHLVRDAEGLHFHNRGWHTHGCKGTRKITRSGDTSCFYIPRIVGKQQDKCSVGYAIRQYRI